MTAGAVPAAAPCHETIMKDITSQNSNYNFSECIWLLRYVLQIICVFIQNSEFFWRERY